MLIGLSSRKNIVKVFDAKRKQYVILKEEMKNLDVHRHIVLLIKGNYVAVFSSRWHVPIMFEKRRENPDEWCNSSNISLSFSRPPTEQFRFFFQMNRSILNYIEDLLIDDDYHINISEKFSIENIDKVRKREKNEQRQIFIRSVTCLSLMTLMFVYLSIQSFIELIDGREREKKNYSRRRIWHTNVQVDDQYAYVLKMKSLSRRKLSEKEREREKRKETKRECIKWQLIDEKMNKSNCHPWTNLQIIWRHSLWELSPRSSSFLSVSLSLYSEMIIRSFANETKRRRRTRKGLCDRNEP